MQTKLLVVGVGGYGAQTLRFLEECVDAGRYKFEGVVDPFAEKSERYDWLVSRNIPIYKDMDEFFARHKAELTIINSPVFLHKEQIIKALRNGSHVLCEKPLVPLVQELAELRAEQEKSGKLLGVGFQWSHCDVMRRLKKDILDGKLGRPLSMKSLISWQRFDSYYKGRGWGGLLRDKDGRWLLDSVFTNATAHYLHNTMFLLGDDMFSAAMPKSVFASLYRAKDIESCDTSFISGTLGDGVRFTFVATHSAEINENVHLQYIFEHATVSLNMDGREDNILTVRYNSGETADYGNPDGLSQHAAKIVSMLDCIENHTPTFCSIDTVTPYTSTVNAVFDYAPIHDFPADIIFRTTDNPGSFVKGLFEVCKTCFEKEQFPHELGVSWAYTPENIPVTGYNEFTGKLFL